ncbi:MAG: c-type cytochrome [Gemmatimonadales bacterium]
MFSRFRRRGLCRVLLAVTPAISVAACEPEQPPAEAVVAWSPPPDSLIPHDSLGTSIRRGLAILEHTPDSLPTYATSSLNCTSCHLEGGRRAGAAPLLGVNGRFPGYLARAGAVVPIEDRINYCMTRSLAGYRLPSDSREMQDIVAYLGYLSKGLPFGASPEGLGFPAIPALEGDSARGAGVYAARCATCHGPEGEGGAYPRAPALWGPGSYSIGASMAIVERAAAFIRHNMPLSAPGTLTDQEAWDVAAYINGHARPDTPGKEEDWPFGGAPKGVPYATVGRVPERASAVLPRANAQDALVPVPRSVRAPSPRLH